MKPIAYYTTTVNKYPNKLEYTTVYMYHKGALIYETSNSKDPCIAALKQDYPNAVIQKLIRIDEYNKARDTYLEEANKLIEQFKTDLFEHFKVQDHPKRNLCYQLAYDRGHANGYQEIYNEFEDLVQLILWTHADFC